MTGQWLPVNQSGRSVADVCDKPTSRLMGFAGVVVLPDDGGGPVTRFRSSVRGPAASR